MFVAAFTVERRCALYHLTLGDILVVSCSQDVRDKLIVERERLFTALSSMSFLEPNPSSANFILCKVNFPRWAQAAVLLF